MNKKFALPLCAGSHIFVTAVSYHGQVEVIRVEDIYMIPINTTKTHLILIGTCHGLYRSAILRELHPRKVIYKAESGG